MRRVLFFILAVLLIDNVAVAQSAPQTWGLCIGISEYTPKSLTLKWADKDAIEFSAFLRHKLNLPEDHYRILKNSEATRENILESLGWLSMSANEGDRVYIFYSGHGKNNSPILPYDSDNLLTLDTIKKALNKIDAHDIVFFADACYSGKLAGKGAKAAIEREHLTGLSKGLIIDMAQAKIGTIIMTSANGIQEAYELDNQKNGIFTYHLMKILMNHAQYKIADLDENGEVSLYEIYRYVHKVITPESQQEPQISDSEKAKQIVLFSFSLTIEDSIVEIAPEPSKGMSKTTKVALGVGAVAALGGGIALAIPSDDNGDGACGGTEVGGYCWYYGEPSQSCNTVCASHGGYHEATRTYAGSDGSTNNCNQVLDALGAPGEWQDIVYWGGSTGCSYDTREAVRVWGTLDTTPEAEHALKRRACACNQ